MKRARLPAFCRVATAYETRQPSPQERAHYRALLISRPGVRWIQCDLPYIDGPGGRTVVASCTHAHGSSVEALECAWQLRASGGHAVGDPVAWGAPPALEDAPP